MRFIFVILFGFLLFWAISPSPFPFGNQDPYLFWAVNKSCGGCLNNDLLAAQPDGFPLFTALFQFFPIAWFPPLSHLLCLGGCCVYAYSLLSFLGFKKDENDKSVYFSNLPNIALILLLHSGLLWGFFCKKFLGTDLNWLWHHGLAEQGLLFGYLQPSVSGVFLLLGLAFLYQERITAFILAITLAGAFHANYIVLGAMIFLAFIFFKPRLALQHILWFVLPAIAWGIYGWYSLENFTPNSLEFITASRYFIQNNPHLDPLNWLNASSLFQLLIMVSGIWTIRQTDFGKFLFLLFSLGVLLSVAALLSQNVFLVNLSPWRLSVVLMPLSLILLVNRISQPQFSTFLFSLGIVMLASAMFFKFFGNSSSDYLLKWRIGTAILVLKAGIVLYFKPQKHLPSLLILGILMGGVIQYCFEKLHIANLPEAQAEAYIETLPNTNSLYLVPPDIRCFTLKTLAPAYLGNTVYFSPQLPLWKKHQEFEKAFFKNPAQFPISFIKSEKITHLLCSRQLMLPSSVWTLDIQLGQMNLYKRND